MFVLTAVQNESTKICDHILELAVVKDVIYLMPNIL
jgi:hypothetical protein